MKNKSKVIFRLVQDEFGYPPADSESVWASVLPNGNYCVENIPFYIQGISSGDEIAVNKIGGDIFFRALVVPSKNSTFRLLLSDPEARDDVRKKLNALGCVAEFHKLVGLLAVEIPAEVAIEPFLEYVISAQERDEMDIQEGALRHKLSG